MSTLLAIRHNVADFAVWRVAYDQAATIRAAHGCTADSVFRSAEFPNDVFVTHEFPSHAQASAFVADPQLQTIMMAAGVASTPRFEIFDRA